MVGPRDTRGSKRLLPEKVNGKQQELLCFLLDIIHHHKEGTGKQNWNRTRRPAVSQARGPQSAPEPPRASPDPGPRLTQSLKGFDLTSLVEQKTGEKANSNNSNRQRLNHIKEGKASWPHRAGPPHWAHAQQQSGADWLPSAQGQEQEKQEEARQSQQPTLCLKIWTQTVWIWMRPRGKYFKRFFLDYQLDLTKTINWSNFSLEKSHFCCPVNEDHLQKDAWELTQAMPGGALHLGPRLGRAAWPCCQLVCMWSVGLCHLSLGDPGHGQKWVWSFLWLRHLCILPVTQLPPG